VRLLTTKPVSDHVGASGSAAELVRTIARLEKKYQEDLNLSFAALSEGAFKGLRRQLPISRQKIDWYKIGNYRVGSLRLVRSLQIFLTLELGVLYGSLVR
jgi:capping protein (actin filament) muscle Z-line, alpha